MSRRGIWPCCLRTLTCGALEIVLTDIHFNLFLLSSIEEGIANVCIEAMALGIPVISTDCGGMAELITNKETGFLVPVRNAQAIASAILEFKITDEKEVNTLRAKARIKVLEQHSEQKMVIDMLQLYEKTIR
mgnify:CR=1 FL=1